MRTPKQLRSDISTLTQHLNQIRGGLSGRASIRLAKIGKECQRTADALEKLLELNQLPEEYKVAVVGRFKTGKSSFVNELLGAKLASEDTNPETAAITSFRHGSKIKATIRFVPLEDWQELQQIYAKDEKDVTAHRLKTWQQFSKPAKSKEGEALVPYDIPSFENKYLKLGGHSITIDLEGDDSKKAQTEFRNRLKEFTSSTKPLHCLVEGIEITSPAPILEEGVLLVDTPGLDDPERFRVSLTEQIVAKVDAVLFLTKSGGSYGQAEKDFLLNLLRKGTVKQLIVVITQMDQTYEQHTREAEENDVDPDPMSKRVAIERERIQKGLHETLADLDHSGDGIEMNRYREQLGEVEIAFTSAALHRDAKANKPQRSGFEIYPDDPGGVQKLTQTLLRLLSTESRLANVALNIQTGAKETLLDLQTVLQNKLNSLRSDKDKEVAVCKLQQFRDQFGEASTRFKGVVEQQVTLLSDRLHEKNQQHAIQIENITLRAEQQIATFEGDDLGRHWRTRRSGSWGYLNGFQSRVANHIFPSVQRLLNENIKQFAQFTKSFEIFLNRLATDGAKIFDELELGDTLPFDVTNKLKETFERSLNRADELIKTEETRVTTLLAEFVSDDVAELISEKRPQVSAIWGSGTTVAQSVEVRKFYREVKRLLAAALTEHLKTRDAEFGRFLINEAKNSPRDALDEVNLLLEQAADNITAVAEARAAGDKHNAEEIIKGIETELNEVLPRAEAISTDASPIDKKSSESTQAVTNHITTINTQNRGPLMTSHMAEISTDNLSWTDTIQLGATVCIERFRLQDGATGWPLERIFPAKYLKGGTQVCLIDPYLAKPHQSRNLKAFLLLIAETIKPKSIEIVTAFSSDDEMKYQERDLSNTATELFKEYGVVLTWHHTADLHDRFVILDHGVLFKLGRGLDIYKPSTGLAAHRAASRKVRSTDIDLFVTPSLATVE